MNRNFSYGVSVGGLLANESALVSDVAEVAWVHRTAAGRLTAVPPAWGLLGGKSWVRRGRGIGRRVILLCEDVGGRL